MSVYDSMNCKSKLAIAMLLPTLLLLQSCVKQQENDSAMLTVSLPLVKFVDPPQLNIKLAATTPCTGPVRSRPLVQPQEISANANGLLETKLVVREIDRCVPVWVKNSKTGLGRWEWQTKKLRTYGFPKNHALPFVPSDKNHPNTAWSAPGPTFILNAGSAPNRADGSRFKMTLYNYMEPTNDYDICDPLIPSVTNPHYNAPNCFHGNNVTNFHFHGFHISPQAHQDYVLLSLEPFGSSFNGESPHPHGDTAIGSYDYDVPPLRGNQAPGTHWYHAHKHGATALQVLNGLIGTFEVHGEFDKQLDAIFAKRGNKLEDRLMVVQQLDDQLPGLGGTKAAYPLINGQASPVVKMQPGEVQRWRFVGATMQASAQLEIGFEEEANGSKPDPTVRQIAMDGVQFAPENYACQPLINGPDCSTLADPTIEDFNLNPGNRIDLLVKAPVEPGNYYMTFRVIGKLGEDISEEIILRDTQLVSELKSVTDVKRPPLLILAVEGPNKVMELPTVAEFPKLPSYLADLAKPATPDNKISYQMSDQGTPEKVYFTINNKQYDPHCVDETFQLNKVDQIQLDNNSANIAHPFHIHINPFQLLSTKTYDSSGKPVVTTYKAPYVWMDTLALPTASSTNSNDLGLASIRYEALDFTGEFVDHCHILGHEDRGMMQNVQATCANGNWGKPTRNGSSECIRANIPPRPVCN